MFQVSHYAFSPDELPETVIVRDSAASASVKDEPGETPVTKSEPDIPPPPPNLIVKEDVDDDKITLMILMIPVMNPAPR